MQESFAYGVRGEEGSLPGWGWEEKETDIYQVRLPLSVVEVVFMIRSSKLRTSLRSTPNIFPNPAWTLFHISPG